MVVEGQGQPGQCGNLKPAGEESCHFPVHGSTILFMSEVKMANGEESIHDQTP